MISIFEQQRHKPIFVIYGNAPQFETLTAAFIAQLQARPEVLYLPVDLAQEACQAPEDELFAIIEIFLNALLEISWPPAQQTRLLAIFRVLYNLRRKVRTYAPAEQLAEFVRFNEFACYPVLQALFAPSPNSSARSVLVGLQQFERLSASGDLVYNYFIEHLLHALTGIDVRFLVLAQQAEPPDLFYGSGAEHAFARVCAYRMPAAPEG